MFWWRGNPFAAKVSYALNGAGPVEIGFNDKRGEYMISEKPDHRLLAWIKVGKVALKAGENTITFDIHGKINNSGDIDCFLFDNTGFVPSGADTWLLQCRRSDHQGPAPASPVRRPRAAVPPAPSTPAEAVADS